jgi:shikimate dehydrogenase
MGLSVRFVDLTDEPSCVAALKTADVVVSTVPNDAGSTLASALWNESQSLSGVLLDVVYDPLVTALAQTWSSLGGQCIGGERMLLHQAGEQVRLMTGVPAPLSAMDVALREVLPSS